MQDLVEERGQLLLVKGREAAQQDVEDDAHRPEVDLVRVRVRVRVGVGVRVRIRIRVRVRVGARSPADAAALPTERATRARASLGVGAARRDYCRRGWPPG